METICNRMVDVHGKRHDKFAVIFFKFTPSDHRGEKFSLVKNVNVKMGVFYPRQARHIKKIRRLIN